MKALAICNCKRLQKWNWKNSNFCNIFQNLLAIVQGGRKALLLFNTLILIGVPAISQDQTPPAFRLHLSKEPTNLDPSLQKTSAASWLLGNIHRNLLSYDNDKGLIPDLGKFCENKSAKIIACKLRKNLRWSDGSELTAQDFLNTYKKILDPQSKSPRADLLFDILNAEAIYQGKKKKLGISAPDKSTLLFELNNTNSEFIYNLASLSLSPSKDKKDIYSGPYKIKTWLKGSKIILESNPFFHIENKSRPPVEFIFVSEDSVALKLYEKGELQLLRRVPTLFIPSFKVRKDFHFIPVTRFDYFGFGPELKEKPLLRKAFALSLNYPELQKIFSSPGTPGCAGLPDSWFKGPAPCILFDKKTAKEAFDKLSSEDTKKTYNFLFSSLGLEDHKRATEWMQSQWLQLGLKVNPAPRDHKIFLEELRNNTPAIFREGVAPDHPSCLSALENFTQRDSKDYLHFQSSDFEKIVNQLRKSSKVTDQKKFCTQGVRYLLDNYILIPTGAYDISMLIDTRFTGWRFNRSGHLDLGQLSFVAKNR